MLSWGADLGLVEEAHDRGYDEVSADERAKLRVHVG